MKAYGGVEIHLHSFLTIELGEVKGYLYAPSPAKQPFYPLRGLQGKIFCLYQESSHNSVIVQHCTDWVVSVPVHPSFMSVLISLVRSSFLPQQQADNTTCLNLIYAFFPVSICDLDCYYCVESLILTLLCV